MHLPGGKGDGGALLDAERRVPVRCAQRHRRGEAPTQIGGVIELDHSVAFIQPPQAAIGREGSGQRKVAGLGPDRGQQQRRCGQPAPAAFRTRHGRS
jgi:hypothetical protein